MAYGRLRLKRCAVQSGLHAYTIVAIAMGDLEEQAAGPVPFLNGSNARSRVGVTLMARCAGWR